MKAIFHWHGHGHLMKTILQLRFSLPRYSRLNQHDIKTNTWGRGHSIRLSLVAFTSYPLNLSSLNQITECIFQDQAIFHHVYIPHGLYSNAVSNHPYPLYTISWHPSFSWKQRTHVLSIPRPIWPSSFLRVSLVEIWASNVMSPFKFSISQIFIVQRLHFFWLVTHCSSCIPGHILQKSCSFNAFHYPCNYSQHGLYSAPDISSPLLCYASDFVISPSHQCFQ